MMARECVYFNGEELQIHPGFPKDSGLSLERHSENIRQL